MRNIALLGLLLCSCAPTSLESVPSQPAPSECAGYLHVMRVDGEGASLSLRSPEGDVWGLPFWRGAYAGNSGAVTGGQPRLVSCGERCLQAAGDLVGDRCAEALWRSRARWQVTQSNR